MQNGVLSGVESAIQLVNLVWGQGAGSWWSGDKHVYIVVIVANVAKMINKKEIVHCKRVR